MAYSIESTLAELIDNAAPCNVLEKHIPGMTTDPQIGMARGMSLSMVAGFSGGRITDAHLAAINEDLKKL